MSEIQGVGCFGPIAEHYRHGGKHLHGNAVAITLLDTSLRVPYVVSDLAEYAITDHHPRTTRLVMLQSRKAAVAVFRIEVRPLARQNVSVNVDFHSRNCRAIR